MDMRAELEAMRRNSIFLEIGGAAERTVGRTRFGGVPDVPEGFVWPVFETATYDDDEVKPRPLSFLAQFNCAELTPLGGEGLLPETGLLSFFYETNSQRWGYDPEDAGCARVFWFEDVSALAPARAPDALESDFRFPALGIKAQPKESLPLLEGFFTDFDVALWEEFDRVRRELVQKGEDMNVSKLLGWPDIIQNNMTQECELVSRGYYLGGDWKQIPEAEKEQAKQTSREDWRLLFQLDTVESKEHNFELMFGDCGRIYFYIRKEDLKARRFDRVWLILQCC